MRSDILFVNRIINDKKYVIGMLGWSEQEQNIAFRYLIDNKRTDTSVFTLPSMPDVNKTYRNEDANLILANFLPSEKNTAFIRDLLHENDLETYSDWTWLHIFDVIDEDLNIFLSETISEDAEIIDSESESKTIRNLSDQKASNSKLDTALIDIIFEESLLFDNDDESSDDEYFEFDDDAFDEDDFDDFDDDDNDDTSVSSPDHDQNDDIDYDELLAEDPIPASESEPEPVATPKPEAKPAEPVSTQQPAEQQSYSDTEYVDNLDPNEFYNAYEGRDLMDILTDETITDEDEEYDEDDEDDEAPVRYEKPDIKLHNYESVFEDKDKRPKQIRIGAVQLSMKNYSSYNASSDLDDFIAPPSDPAEITKAIMLKLKEKQKAMKAQIPDE